MCVCVCVCGSKRTISKISIVVICECNVISTDFSYVSLSRLVLIFYHEHMFINRQAMKPFSWVGKGRNMIEEILPRKEV